MCFVNFGNRGSLIFRYIWMVKYFVINIMSFSCSCSGGSCIILKVSRSSRLVWKVFLLIIVGRSVFVVYINCIFICNGWLSLMCFSLLYLIMCNNFFCIIIGVVVSLSRNSVLLSVCLNFFGWCFCVSVNVFVLWLNSLEFSRFLFNVV